MSNATRHFDRRLLKDGEQISIAGKPAIMAIFEGGPVDQDQAQFGAAGTEQATVIMRRTDLPPDELIIPSVTKVTRLTLSDDPAYDLLEMPRQTRTRYVVHLTLRRRVNHFTGGVA